MKKWLIACLFVLLAPLATIAADKPIKVAIFTRTGCPHCASAKAHLANLKAGDYPTIDVTEYNLLETPKNIEKYYQFQKAYGIIQDSVPLIFIGDRVVVGYQPNDINSVIENCKVSSVCQDPHVRVANFLSANPDATPTDNTATQSYIGWILAALFVGGIGFFVLRGSR